MIEIRPVIDSDFEAIAAIYAYYVTNTRVTAEFEVPTAVIMKTRADHYQENGLPYLVALDQGQIVGFGYLAPYSDRLGYRYAVTLSIYLDPNKRGKGLGKSLLAALETKALSMPIRHILSLVSSDNTVSLDFHQGQGFSEIGRFPQAMQKLGAWVDLVWLLKSYEENKELWDHE